jgi:hypothetical protein
VRKTGTIAGAASALAAWAAFIPAAGAQQPAPPQAQAPASPQADAAAAFHAEITRLYRADRTAPDRRADMQAVSDTLDAFWNRVKADKATYLPLLRAELVRPGNPPFFYFDGAELLRDASDSRADGALALSVIERVDLSQIELSGYLIALNFYVNHGYDTRRAALRWLDLPRDTTIIVQPLPHTFYYDRFEALIFSLFAMDEQRFVGDLAARLQATHDDLEIRDLLTAIWLTATPEGRAAIAAFSEDTARPAAARQFARDVLAWRGEGAAPTQSEAELRQARREILAHPFVHDSFDHFRAITEQLVRATAPGQAPAPQADARTH